jgi:hypothetical protein
LVALTFDGNICNGAQPCTNGATIDQNYGDTLYCDVQYTVGVDVATSGTIAPQGGGFSYWTAYGALSSVAYGSSSGTFQQVFLRGVVTLQYFRISGFSSAGMVAVKIVDAATGVTVFDAPSTTFDSTTPTLISGPWSSNTGLAIQLGPDLYNAAVDDIVFFADTTATLAPLTTTTATPTTTLPPTTVPPGMTLVVLDFEGNICDGAQPCTNGGVIDQTYGDTPYSDVQYTAGLDPAILNNGTIAPQGGGLSWYTAYGPLTGIAYGSSSGTTQQILILGVGVELRSFDIAGFSSAGTCSVKVVDVASGAILFDSPDAVYSNTVVSSFSGPWTSTEGLAIQLGPDLYFAGVDNIVYLASTAVTRAPTTTGPPTTSTSQPTTAAMVTALQQPVVVRSATNIGNVFLSGGAVGETQVCFVKIEANIEGRGFVAYLGGERIPLTTFDVFGTNPNIATVFSFHYVATGLSRALFIPLGGHPGVVMCQRISGAFGIDDFVSGQNSQPLGGAVNLRTATYCPGSLILTGMFSAIDSPGVAPARLAQGLSSIPFPAISDGFLRRYNPTLSSYPDHVLLNTDWATPYVSVALVLSPCATTADS